MKKLIMMVLGLMCAVGMAGMAIAGSIDSPGAPSAGSGMYTLQNLYDYLTSGAALTVPGSFQEPGSGPGSTMKSTKEIGDGIKAKFVLCDATAADVKTGKKFFCTQAGSWGVMTGTMAPAPLYSTLLKTGMTSSYRTGDDGYYQRGAAFSYTLTTDTATDNVTGLMWARDGNGVGCNMGASSPWSVAIDWAEGLVFAGYSDWRLPNITEIQTIIVRRVTTAPYINETAFTNTRGNSDFGYLSSTPAQDGWGGSRPQMAFIKDRGQVSDSRYHGGGTEGHMRPCRGGM